MFGKTLKFLFKTVGSVLAIVGGACGIVTGAQYLFVGDITAIFKLSKAVEIRITGLVAILFGVVGIISGVFVSKNTKAFGFTALIIGITGFFLCSHVWTIAGIFLILSGILILKSIY